MLDPKIQAVLDGSASYVVVEGDCLDVLRTMPDASVDAVVTDPPAGIAFMGKKWDDPRAWEQPITEHGFTDGGDRRPAPTIGTSTRNPMCRVCHLHKRGWKDHPGCSCASPEFDDGDHRLDVRRYFVEWLSSIMVECLRVLKPGGHALVWSIPRTSHWTATAVEDAGFEIRDVIAHLFGSGFPKSLDVSKAIDKAAGVEREVVGRRTDGRYAYEFKGTANRPTGARAGTDDAERIGGFVSDKALVTAPATLDAATWSGWGTALKPAREDWILARKPLDGTVAANVCRHGTGAINVDACRVGTPDNRDRPRGTFPHSDDACGNGHLERTESHPAGRWPANLVLSHTSECRCVGTKRVKCSADPSNTGSATTKDSYGTFAQRSLVGHADSDGKETVEAWECAPDCPVRLLDKQSGSLTSGTGAVKRATATGHQGNALGADSRPVGTPMVEYGDTGGASRFFYVAKADKAERNLGGTVNKHPTVKPLDLMRWLCRLITPPGAVVLDPFAGSGSTVVAALREGFRCIGIEREAESVATARRRVEEDAPLLRRERPTLAAPVSEVTQAEPRQLSLLSDAIKP